MKDGKSKITRDGIRFYYKTNETKYYLLTGGSGYPLADFSFPDLPANTVTRLVVPENAPKTLNVVTEKDPDV